MKNLLNTGFLSIGLTFCCNYANAAIISGPIINPTNNNTYYLLNSANWTQSENEAIALGGHLVTINDQTENNWVFDTFSTFGGVNRALWTGYNDGLTEGDFVWSSGETPIYTNWAGNQPDDGNTPSVSEDYVHLLWPTHPNTDPGQWNDFQNLSSVNGFTLNGVVEISTVVPVPAAVWLFGSGLIGLIGMMKKKSNVV